MAYQSSQKDTKYKSVETTFSSIAISIFNRGCFEVMFSGGFYSAVNHYAENKSTIQCCGGVK
ncbi:hypothetical protein HMPREF0454_04164 [Hafnia alvei ATCC 51873]|uniref:Uncharacterized protein n=1 Tax=Hafnia alvei ATCC 51873 TaxID=1002364 RepID=G9YC37_HAFAL|nr:hypothetical protein HMPREF0454_04164 [Hafnia alvei ATCC 51873]